METKKLLVGALAATALTIGGGAAIAATENPADAEAKQAAQQQEPTYTGSVKAPGMPGENEAAEDKESSENEAAETQKLQGLAKIDQKAAEDAALQKVPGTVKDAQFGNENGYVVYEVEVAGNDGTLHEIKVDAGNGQVLQQEADDGGSEQGAANEANEGPEGPEANEPAETTGK